jgi:predicted phosphate transport protein (TIGR00153 family)
MRSIAKVFGRSPFVPLQMHMEKVAECVGKLPEILDAYRRQDSETVTDLVYILSRTEHEADLIKHDIRNNMPRGLFMPIDRANLLRILNIQDSIANRAENIGVLLTFKQAGTFDEFDTAFDAFVAKCLEAFNLTREIIDQLDELLETGFGGAEAQNVQEMVDKVAFKEYESDLSQRELLRLLLAHEDAITYGDFFLWTRIIQQVGGLADRSNNLAAALRMTLDTK